MNALTVRLLVAVLFVGAANPAAAQTATGVPPAIWAQVEALGPVVDPLGVGKIYAQLRAQMPTDGVKKTLDIPYGPANLQKLDVYEPSAAAAMPAPVLIFIHGGAFVGGSKNSYDNIGYYFARHGVVTVLADYRLAPSAGWPAGANDVAGAVAWTRANIAAHGGNPAKIVLFGHSAGATHVAAYAFEKRFQPASGSGLAGVIVGSGIYDPSLDPLIPGPPNATDASYYGADTSTYAARATARHVDAAKIPTLIFEVELDPLPMLVANGTLYSVLCHRDHQCPTMYRFLMHDHISAPAGINTGDESVSAPLLDFIRAR